MRMVLRTKKVFERTKVKAKESSVTKMVHSTMLVRAPRSVTIKVITKESTIGCTIYTPKLRFERLTSHLSKPSLSASGKACKSSKALAA